MIMAALENARILGAESRVAKAIDRIFIVFKRCYDILSTSSHTIDKSVLVAWSHCAGWRVAGGRMTQPDKTHVSLDQSQI